MQNALRKATLLLISILLLLGSCCNLTSSNLNSVNTLKEKLVNQFIEKKSINEKLENTVINLLSGNEKSYSFNERQIKDFTFVDEKVRLEVILTDENQLNSLVYFSKDIVIENHYMRDRLRAFS